MENNPYRPPRRVARPAPPSPTLGFRRAGAIVVDGLAAWMRFVGVFHVIGGALLVIGTLWALTHADMTDALVLIAVPLFATMAVVNVAGGLWLSRAGGQFRAGVRSGSVTTMGSGFATFRKYTMLFAAMSLLTLFANLLRAVIS